MKVVQSGNEVDVIRRPPVAVKERKPATVVRGGPIVQGSSSERIFVQPDPPTAPAPWFWVETGLGAGGHDVTFWVEDGL